ncbi:peptide-binding protein [Deferribacter autotrophicus]|uniref:Peptide-binding protein n=1 Tax=Deferribacter autotrophicus TaxID=500465 RepID=A0A5A8F113_9BACT|nr:peptide-binding protein [Deferribacter autotrophicus]KAA0257758.1 peptide-binding protein [Deferribacter autotrophicus]
MRFLKLFIIFFFVINLFSCSEGDKNNSPSAEYKKDSTVEVKAYGDALVEGSIGDASNLIPILATDSASHSVAGLIYNGLLKYDKNLNLVGDLAEKWEVSENKKIITFYLRKGVKWHDGAPFTAEDVKFTYKLIVDDKTPTAYDADFRLIDRVDVVDNYTVKVFYKKAYAPALSSWTISILPSHLLKGVEVTKSPLQRKPVGTGPYKFLEWKSQDHITLVANEDYFEGKPYVERYIFRIIPDTSSMFLELLNENIDLMGLSPLQYTKQTENPRFKKSYKKYKYLANSYTYIGYNLKNPFFADKRVRQALSYATPKNDIIKGVLFGLGEIATGPYKPGTIWYNRDVKRYEYDLEKAKELLKEAGWQDRDGDGILEKGKKKFKVTILTNQGNSTRSRIAEIVQQSWKKIGVDVEIRILEWATFISEYIDKRNFQVVILGWSIPQEPDLYDVWHSSNCRDKKLNFICYQNKEVDKLIELARTEFDTEKRKEYYYKIQEIFAEEQPYTFLYVPDALIALHKRFRNVKPAPAGLMYNFIEWYVPKSEQKYHFTQ